MYFVNKANSTHTGTESDNYYDCTEPGVTIYASLNLSSLYNLLQSAGEDCINNYCSTQKYLFTC